jgi:putative endonuclease
MSGGKGAKALGDWGEEMVAQSLLQKGWQIQERNFRCRYGEVDVIAADRRYLIFVEVKLRKNEQFGSAAASVTLAKQKRLRQSAEFYLQRHPTDLQPRFDVAEVYAPGGRQTDSPEIFYIENAF